MSDQMRNRSPIVLASLSLGLAVIAATALMPHFGRADDPDHGPPASACVLTCMTETGHSQQECEAQCELVGTSPYCTACVPPFCNGWCWVFSGDCKIVAYFDEDLGYTVQRCKCV